jgi:hypothetical protein
MVVLLAGILVAGCFGVGEKREKSPGSALWIGPGSKELEASEVARLQESGIRELMVEVAELDPGAPQPLVPVTPPALPPSIPTTLAIEGRWSGGGDPAGLAERVLEGARQLRFDQESRGVVVVGWHFDLETGDSLGSYADFLDEIRSGLDDTLFLSASLGRDDLDAPDLERVAEAVDFVVPFLYGQRVQEQEDGEAWDFVRLERQLRRLEEVGVPYLLGVVTLGTATHLSDEGAVKARTTGLSLQEILWNRDLKLRPGFSLEGVNRRVYSVNAERRTEVGKWEVRAGESIRVVRPATSDLEELMRLAGVWELPNYLGQLYYRLPSPDERLSLSLENLVNALEPVPATPDLHLDASLQRRTGRGWLARFSITNENGEITELSLVDSNYLQVQVLNGEFSQHRVQPGDFYRYDLYRTTDDGGIERGFRHPDVLRLFLPILEGEQQVASGDVEIYVRGEPELELVGNFLLSDGRELAVGPVRWPADDEDDG